MFFFSSHVFDHICLLLHYLCHSCSKPKWWLWCCLWDSLGSLMISHEPLGNSWPTSQRIRLLHSPAIQIVVSWTLTLLWKEQKKNFQVGKNPLFPPMMNVFFSPCYSFFQESARFFPDMKRAAGVAGVKLSSARDSLRDSETRLEIRVAVVAFCLGCLEFWKVRVLGCWTIRVEIRLLSIWLV